MSSSVQLIKDSLNVDEQSFEQQERLNIGREYRISSLGHLGESAGLVTDLDEQFNLCIPSALP